jgi:hypothetical protein
LAAEAAYRREKSLAYRLDHAKLPYRQARRGQERYRHCTVARSLS